MPIDYDTRFEDYQGDKRYTVTAPKHKPIVVAAPDETSAIAAAGKYFGEKRTAYSFYAFTTVERI